MMSGDEPSSADSQQSRCVFCDAILSGCRTREHVFAQWAIDEFQLDEDRILATHFSADGKVLSDRCHNARQIILGRVCAECNNGWMSQLENGNKRVITELGHGRMDTFDLDDTAATLLARWTFKTALALHAASNYRRIVPTEHYRHAARSDADLPSDVFVFGKTWTLPPSGFCWWQSPSWWVHQPGRQLAASEQVVLKKEAYKICICLSRLLLLVAFNPLPGTRILAWQYVHVPLWPRRGPVAWLQKPPELPTDEPNKAAIAYLGSLGLVPL
jgi:hypothetical protein